MGIKSIDGTEAYPFISSYFILDITYPEKSPVLLGELTDEFDVPAVGPNDDVQVKTKSGVDLGYSTSCRPWRLPRLSGLI